MASHCYAYPRSSYIFTPEDWQAVLAHLQDGHNITAAARSVGASRQAVYDHMERNPAFREAVEACKAEGIDSVEDWMLEKARNPTGFLANVAWLKAHRPGKWRDDRPAVAQPIINITIVAPSAVELRDIIDGDYRMLSSDSVQISAPGADDTMLHDAASLTEDS